MQFHPGAIPDIILKPLSFYHDQRGWLCELFRHDELPEQFWPVMAYISMTQPGIARGPHEHVQQADYFCFIGPSDFKLFLWDNRPASPTYRTQQVEILGQSRPMAVVVPPGVVHGYKNVGSDQGIVFNGANQLYKGQGKQKLVDEIRHEADTGSVFRME
jgi:dTDP-4-dehydrorhamnose 3,5-epimerase